MTYKSIYNIIVLTFLLSFFKGALYILGFNVVYLQLIIEALVVILFIISLFYSSQHNSMKFYNNIVVLLFFIVVLISFLLNNTNWLQFLLFYRHFFVYYLFLFALLNIKLPIKYMNKIFNLIVFLFILQIPAAFIKLGLIGTKEYYIGTMQYLGGSLATIMPLMAIAYLIANYLASNKIIYIIFIFLFIAIGLISIKLGILFYVGVLFVIMSYIESVQQTNRFSNTRYIVKLFILLFVFSIIFIGYVKINPRANPEHKIGGSVDVEYLLDYSKKYNTMKEKGSKVEGDGRFDAPSVALNRLESGGYFNILFGFGPGDIVQSSYTKYSNPLLEKYRIGYGGRIGLVWMLMQVGILGTFLFVFFHLLLLRKLFSKYFRKKMDSNGRILTLTAIGFVIIFLLDFFSYSKVLMDVPGIVLTYFFMIYYVLENVDDKNSLLKEEF